MKDLKVEEPKLPTQETTTFQYINDVEIFEKARKKKKKSRQTEKKTKGTLPQSSGSTRRLSQDENLKILIKTWPKSRVIATKTKAIILISIRSQKTSSSFSNLLIND